MIQSALVLLPEVENDYRYHQNDLVEVFGIHSVESSGLDVPDP